MIVKVIPAAEKKRIRRRQTNCRVLLLRLAR